MLEIEILAEVWSFRGLKLPKIGEKGAAEAGPKENTTSATRMRTTNHHHDDVKLNF